MEIQLPPSLSTQLAFHYMEAAQRNNLVCDIHLSEEDFEEQLLVRIRVDAWHYTSRKNLCFEKVHLWPTPFQTGEPITATIVDLCASEFGTCDFGATEAVFDEFRKPKENPTNFYVRLLA